MTGHFGQRALFLNSGQRVVHRIANDVRSAQDSDNRTVLHDGHFLQFMLRQKRACLLERCVLRNAHDAFRGNMRNGERNKLFELFIERLAIWRFHERIRARNRWVAFREVAHNVAIGNEANRDSVVIHNRHTAHFAIDQLMHDLPNRHSALYDKGGLFHKQSDFSELLGLGVLGGGIAPL